MRIRGISGLVAVLGAMVIAPAGAQAAAVGIGVTPDPLEDRAITFTATADTGGANAEVYAKYRVADGNPCALSYAGAVGETIFSGSASGTQKQLTIKDPASYVICSWLQDGIGSTTPLAAAAQPLAVRANVATLAIQAPPFGTTGVDTPITFTGTTEIGRSLYARLKPQGAGPCAQSSAGEPTLGGSFASGEGLAGAFNIPRLAQSEREPGMYTICAWVQESGSDPVAEVAATAPLRILPPRPQPSELNFGKTSFPAVTYGASITKSFAGGTGINFQLNTSATARFTVYRRVGRRYKRVRGSFTYQAKNGYNFFRFSGRVGGRTLKRGRYRMAMSTTNAAGKGIVRRKVFRITRRP